MRTRLAWVLRGIVTTVAGLSFAWAWTLEPRPLHQVTIAHDKLVGEDGAGRTLWTASLAPDEIVPGSDHWQRIVRLRDDGPSHVLALLQRRRPASDEPLGGALVNLSTEGRRGWMFSADDHRFPRTARRFRASTTAGFRSRPSRAAARRSRRSSSI